MTNFISIKFPTDSNAISTNELQNINKTLHALGLRCEKISDKPQEQNVCQNKGSNSCVPPSASSKSTRQGPATPGQIHYFYDLCAKQLLKPSNVVRERFHHELDKLTNEEANILINRLK